MRYLVLLLMLSSENVDLDRDSLDDGLEQQLLEKFVPRFHIAADDCDLRPAEFERDRDSPVVKQSNGTIYGQAFRLDDGIELHYFHLWANDCGRSKHPLDAEHVSAFVRMEGKEWRARYWYAAAHEDTICDRGSAARAQVVYAEWRGAEVWISRGKHASFLSAEACHQGCGSDRCDRMERLNVSRIINLGEPDVPLNGSTWLASSAWQVRQKMASDFSREFRAQLDDSHRIVLAIQPNPAVQPVIAAGSSTVDALELANTKTGSALVRAKDSVKKWFEKRMPKP